jgi:hypothetical protein
MKNTYVKKRSGIVECPVYTVLYNVPVCRISKAEFTDKSESRTPKSNKGIKTRTLCTQQSISCFPL